MTTERKKSAIIVLLIITILSLSLYSLQKKSQHDTLQEAFKNDKNDLEKELDEMIRDYTDVVVRKKSISKRLQLELVKMNNLRDSIKILQIDNYSLIRIYRKKISRLEYENKQLFIKVDSLSIANQALTQKNAITKTILAQKETINTSLSDKNNELEEKQKILQTKVAAGSILKINTVNAVAMKERSNGELTSTSRSSRTDAFRVNFDLLENPVADTGKKTVYIQITDQNNNVIAPKGVTNLKNGANIQYTDAIDVNYNNDKLSLVSLILVNRDDINKGKYTISTFIDQLYLGATILNLR
ncbi:hypothetical protein [Tenacibaculum finnmarkense]|uniref:Chromosome partitioning protein ParA n=2 Tax=Tenacibaculum finnmarkense TaxID=2781243 RepID=A0A2I2M6S5_9FLAO|nr:hypothetical protein [Tenacibaculum finnmarkense]ALU75907.1 hypothetical protein AUW17_11890 [Tenacibaculum dicentrarchi]MBE7633371.1 hypothetical protein [Tenacibaculum finnmarkense genomovar ulcerans]MBE7647160.1 hypothetical protein [Tenacibaculum finnmarkense genomovar ulcerans]MBE7686936.1 hypothetical protein [Tenacibaculum finnmarkense genomovar ulcerans]MBE7696496.1 hypothetical protein [Tenacibaculum finnmarkense genomovar ulcerans]